MKKVSLTMEELRNLPNEGYVLEQTNDTGIPRIHILENEKEVGYTDDCIGASSLKSIVNVIWK